MRPVWENFPSIPDRAGFGGAGPLSILRAALRPSLRRGLMETVQNAEISANNFVQMLSRLQNMETGFRIDLDGLLKDLSRRAQENDQHPAAS